MAQMIIDMGSKVFDEKELARVCTFLDQGRAESVRLLESVSSVKL